MAHPKAKLDANGLYTERGIVYRVCPRLLEMDKRHGIDHRKWDPSWHTPFLRDSTTPNPKFLVDPEGHDANTFHYVPGARPETAEEWPTCSNCGKPLVCSDGDPI